MQHPKPIHTLTPLLPVPGWTGDKTDLRPNSNFEKTVRVNIALTRTFFNI